MSSCLSVLWVLEIFPKSDQVAACVCLAPEERAFYTLFPNCSRSWNIPALFYPVCWKCWKDQNQRRNSMCLCLFVRCVFDILRKYPINPGNVLSLLRACILPKMMRCYETRGLRPNVSALVVKSLHEIQRPKSANRWLMSLVVPVH